MASRRPKRKAVDNTATKAKRARGETDLSWGLRWTEAGSEVHGVRPLLLLATDAANLPGRERVAGFDIDSTLIATKSGRKFASGASDWQWLYKGVPEKLKKLHEEGHRIVLFTNQAGIEKGKAKPQDIMTKVEAMLTELAIPVMAFVSTATSHFRKPNMTMWQHFEENCNAGIKVDLGKSLYVGDAAGRAKAWESGKPRDFSCSDRMFAANVGCQFYTPEEFFLEEVAAPFQWGSFDPVEYMKTATVGLPKVTYHSEEQEVIVMTGRPACGKSTFSERHLVPHGYVRVNRDTLHTPAKCIKATQDALKEGKSVVIDNTNPDAFSRSQYIACADKKGVSCRCFMIELPLDLAHHLNQMRMTATQGATRRVPMVGYAVYNKNFAEPSLDEGFTEVKKIQFHPYFPSKKQEELFKKWTSTER